ncbi:LacI family transcriptional regulator [Martelella mediterranea]|uniref:LacI family DNA-binding transcriptional regulator n=1 Tax=Martelella mediterranea TaxID=293089 RepID=UPI001E489FF7|nr:LacI family DNA-binding transcriptional regulator [Martelella mediterranea]MCD1635816.1 LacI family transcriptional regulator [Martelella mediterranea]
MSVTIKQVAEYAGVSAATVSNVLSESKPVREESRRKVVAAVKALNYRANPAASLLRSGKSNVIGAIVPNIQNPFFSAMLAAIERHCGRDGYDLIVASSNDDEATEIARVRSLLTWRPAGLFAIPCSRNFRSQDLITTANVPLVLADRCIDGQNADFVEIDNRLAGRMAAKHLMKLGHSRIAVVAPSFTVDNVKERLAAMTDELGQPAVQIQIGHADSRLSVDEVAARWMDDCTAVVAFTNSATLMALAALRHLGRRVPDDVSLVGFDDYDWMAVAGPSITAIRQPVREMAQFAWDSLRMRIKGGENLNTHTMHRPELIIRESTAPASR